MAIAKNSGGAKKRAAGKTKKAASLRKPKENAPAAEYDEFTRTSLRAAIEPRLAGLKNICEGAPDGEAAGKDAWDFLNETAIAVREAAEKAEYSGAFVPGKARRRRYSTLELVRELQRRKYILDLLRDYEKAEDDGYKVHLCRLIYLHVYYWLSECGTFAAAGKK